MTPVITIPFFGPTVRIAGVLLALAGGFLEWARRTDPNLPWTSGVAWSLLLLGILAVLVSGLERAVDAQDRLLVTRWRLGVAIPIRSTSLAPYKEVLVRAEWRPSSKEHQGQRFLYYVAEVRARKASERREISCSHEYEKERRRAVDVARALALPLRDRPGKIVRSPDELDLDLQGRTSGDGAPAERPDNARTSWVTNGGVTTATIPGPRYSAFTGVISASPLALALLLGWRLGPSFRRTLSEVPAYASAIGLVMGFLALLWLVVTAVRGLHRATLETTLRIDDQGLRICRRSLLGPRRRLLAVQDLREIELGAFGVAVRTATHTDSVGEGLQDKELLWLRDALRDSLTGR